MHFIFFFFWNWKVFQINEKQFAAFLSGGNYSLCMSSAVGNGTEEKTSQWTDLTVNWLTFLWETIKRFEEYRHSWRLPVKFRKTMVTTGICKTTARMTNVREIERTGWTGKQYPQRSWCFPHISLREDNRKNRFLKEAYMCCVVLWQKLLLWTWTRNSRSIWLPWQNLVRFHPHNKKVVEENIVLINWWWQVWYLWHFKTKAQPGTP